MIINKIYLWEEVIKKPQKENVLKAHLVKAVLQRKRKLLKRNKYDLQVIDDKLIPISYHLLFLTELIVRSSNFHPHSMYIGSDHAIDPDVLAKIQ